MKKKSHLITSMAVPLALLFVSTFLYSARPRASAQGSDFNRLTLTISSPKDGLVELEPVPIVVNLRNETNQTIVGHSALGFSNNFVKLFLVGGNGEAREIQNVSPVTGNTAAAPRELGPGESLEVKEALAFHLDKSFPRPGAYRIQAVLYDARWSNEIKSNVLTIHIHHPDGVTLEALNYIKRLGAASYFFSGVGFPSEEQARTALEDFTAKFSETGYGDYAAFLLGEHYFYGKDFTRAEQQLSLLAKKTDFVFADKAKKYLEKMKNDNASRRTP